MHLKKYLQYGMQILYQAAFQLFALVAFLACVLRESIFV